MITKLKIKAFIRPAIPADIFEKNGEGKFIEEKQYFISNKAGVIRGPYRLNEPEVLIFDTYLEFETLLEEKRLFIVDKKQFLESKLIVLELKEAEPDDVVQNKMLKINTTYFGRDGKSAVGPFLIKEDSFGELRLLIENKNMFVLDGIKDLKEIENLTTAEAV